MNFDRPDEFWPLLMDSNPSWSILIAPDIPDRIWLHLIYFGHLWYFFWQFWLFECEQKVGILKTYAELLAKSFIKFMYHSYYKNKKNFFQSKLLKTTNVFDKLYKLSPHNRDMCFGTIVYVILSTSVIFNKIYETHCFLCVCYSDS